MHFGIGVFRTREANCPAIQIGNVRVSDRGPIAGRIRGNAEFPNAFTVIEPARRETLSRRTSYRGRESGAKRVFRLGRAPKIEVVGLPLFASVSLAATATARVASDRKVAVRSAMDFMVPVSFSQVVESCPVRIFCSSSQ